MDSSDLAGAVGKSSEMAGHGGVDIADLRRVVTKVDGVVQRAAAAAKLIRGDAHASYDARASALETLGETYIKRLQEFELWVERGKKRLSMLRGILKVPPAETDDPSRVLREQEVRAELRKLAPGVVKEIFFAAVDDGDRLVFDAVRNAPVFFNILSRDLIEEGRSLWVEKRYPRQARMARELADAISRAESAIVAARRKIAHETDVPAGPPVHGTLLATG